MISFGFLLPMVLASAANITVLEPLNGDCRGQSWTHGDLHVRYFTAGQSCAPGGPCSLMGIHNMPIRDVDVRVNGCPKPLPGTFRNTGRRCRGARLYRFDGVVPPGRDLTLVTPHTSRGTFRSPGRRERLNCAGRPPPPALDVFLAGLAPALSFRLAGLPPNER